MDGRRELTPAEKQKITNEYILPFFERTDRTLDNKLFMAKLQHAYAYAYALQTEKSPYDYYASSNFIKHDAHAAKLGLLYLNEATQQALFPGVTASTLQTFIREFVFHTYLPPTCSEFLLETAKATLLNPSTPLFYALGDLAPLKTSAGFREISRPSSIKTKVLLENFFQCTEESASLFPSLYQAIEAAQHSLTFSDGKYFMRPIWIVGCNQTLEWQRKEVVINTDQASLTYAKNQRLAELRYATVNHSTLTPLKGFVLHNEQAFEDIWCLGKVDKVIIDQYRNNPQSVHVAEPKKATQSGCLVM